MISLSHQLLQPTAKHLLSPLAQRLFLYRFALLQLGPDCRVEPKSWGAPGMETLLKGSSNPWHWSLAPCCDYSEWSLQPLISPHLSLLLKVRQRQPRRPLILCQWAFERPPRAAVLKRLAYPRFHWQRALAEHDAHEPLHWISPFRQSRNPPSGPQPLAEAPCIRLTGYRQHPLSGKLEQVRLACPRAQVWLREDGEPMVQPDLFRGTGGYSWQKRELEGLRLRGQRLRALDAAHRGHWFVWAKEAAPLEWLGCDIVRTLGGRRQLWNYPDVPDPKDPLGHLILAKEADLRSNLVPPASLYLELDQGDAFRDYRESASGDPSWWSPFVSHSCASLEGNGWTCHFIQKPEGWFCWNGASPPPTHNQPFSQWLALFGLGRHRH